MAQLLLLLKVLSAAGITLPQVLLLVEKFGPALEQLIALGKSAFALIENIAKLFQSFMSNGSDPSRAADSAFSIGLHVRPATPEELAVIRPLGFPPDLMHDFEHGMQ